jgi:hypothetical protein
MYKLTQEEFHERVDNYDGICLTCSEWNFGGIEPDAEEYKCEFCENNSVIGAELALILGHLNIEH